MTPAVAQLIEEIRVVKAARMGAKDLNMRESDQWGRVARAIERVRAEMGPE